MVDHVYLLFDRKLLRCRVVRRVSTRCIQATRLHLAFAHFLSQYVNLYHMSISTGYCETEAFLHLILFISLGFHGNRHNIVVLSVYSSQTRNTKIKSHTARALTFMQLLESTDIAYMIRGQVYHDSLHMFPCLLHFFLEENSLVTPKYTFVCMLLKVKMIWGENITHIYIYPVYGPGCWDLYGCI